MQINKGDRIVLSEKAVYKAAKDFDLADVIDLFSNDYSYVEDTMTKDSSMIFNQQLIDWLLQNKYINHTAKSIIVIRVDDLHGDVVNITANKTTSDTDQVLTIPLRVDEKVVEKYSSSCRWRVDKS